VTIGRWRIRTRWHVRQHSGLWWDRTRFREGTVYRAAIGLIQITVMVDAMTHAERDESAKKVNDLLEMLNG
jgi:hypothetical protein